MIFGRLRSEANVPFYRKPPFTGRLTDGEFKELNKAIEKRMEKDGTKQDFRVVGIDLDHGCGTVTIEVWWEKHLTVDIKDCAIIRIRDGNEVLICKDEMSIEDLCEFYQQRMSMEIPQLRSIENKVVEEGSATIFGQAFNDNKELTKREMKALCMAFERDGYAILKSDFDTGEITLALDHDGIYA